MLLREITKKNGVSHKIDALLYCENSSPDIIVYGARYGVFVQYENVKIILEV
jgi:hypothetical protein